MWRRFQLLDRRFRNGDFLARRIAKHDLFAGRFDQHAGEYVTVFERERVADVVRVDRL
jgi:hypothetical protein